MGLLREGFFILCLGRDQRIIFEAAFGAEGGDVKIFVGLLVGIINVNATTVDYFFDDIIKDFPSFRWR